jgi:hypothetical protein
MYSVTLAFKELVKGTAKYFLKNNNEFSIQKNSDYLEPYSGDQWIDVTDVDSYGFLDKNCHLV